MTVLLRKSAPPSPDEAAALQPEAGHGGGGGLVFFLATAALNASNFGFQVLVSRVLGPQTYSALLALLALLVIAGVPLSALQLSCAAAQARLDDPADPARAMRLVGLIALASALLLLAAHGEVDSFLQITSIWPLAWLCAWLVLAALSAVPQGLLIGQSRFTALGLTALVGAGFGRLLMGGVAAELHLGVSGGMAATTVAQGLTLALLLVAVRGRRGRARPPLQLSAAEGALSTAALTGLAVFSAVDTVVARHTLDAVDSGYYAAAATGGRIALFAPGAIAVLAFPRFVRSAKGGDADRRDLLLALAAVAAVGLAVVAAVVVVPDLIVRVLFGTDYLGAEHQLSLLAPAGALLGCLTLATFYHLARGSSFALAAWVGAAAVVGAETRVTLSGDELAASVLAVVALLTTASVGWALVTTAPLSTGRRSTAARRGTATAAAAVIGGESGAIVAPGLVGETD